MSRLTAGGVLLGLVLAGCGGSDHHTAGSTAAPPAGTTTTAASGPGPSTTTTTGASSTSPTPPAGVTTGTGPVPPSVTGSHTTSSVGGQSGSGGSSGARIPATFTIKAGGQANPSSVNAPALVPIQVTIVSGDGKPHTALIRTSPPHTLRVAAGAHASLLLPGQQDGRYVIVLDRGAGLATLLVGGAPGP